MTSILDFRKNTNSNDFCNWYLLYCIKPKKKSQTIAFKDIIFVCRWQYYKINKFQ